LSKTKAVVII